MPPKIKAMLVMAREDRLPLLEALESCGIEVLAVCDCATREKVSILCQHPGAGFKSDKLKQLRDTLERRQARVARA